MLTPERKADSARRLALLWQAVANHARGKSLDAHLAGDRVAGGEAAFIAQGFDKDAARLLKESQDAERRA